MKTVRLFTMLVLASLGLLQAQVLRVDSVSVDSVWNSDSFWTDAGGAGHTRASRDCQVSFSLKGTGYAKLSIAMSVDSGKTWNFSLDSLIVKDSMLAWSRWVGYRSYIMVRVLGGDRKGVAIRMTARESEPKIKGEVRALVPIMTPGTGGLAIANVYAGEISPNAGCSSLAKVYWDANADGIVDDSTSGTNAGTWEWRTQVPAPGEEKKVAVWGMDKNGLWSKPETLVVQFGFLMDAAYRAIGYQYSADDANWYNLWMIGDIVSDDAEKGGESASDIADLYALRNFNASDGNSIIAPQWEIPYLGIFLANNIIDTVPKISMDPVLRARYVAEAKFLRAWSYFILVKTFGDVPLALHALSFKDYCQSRTSKAQVWTQIEADLSQAAAVLPVKSGYAGADIGRATKGAAQALCAKAYLYQGNFAAAKALADSVIRSGEYVLETVFSDNFTMAHENGPESVFEIQYFEDPADSWNNDDGGQVFTVFQGSRDDSYFPGWGFDCPTASLAAEFESGDPRKKATIIAVGDTVYKGTPAQQVITHLSSPTGMNARKYMLEYDMSLTVPDMANAPANWRAIRYSEVLLCDAEASNETDNTTDATRYVNMVRARAGLPPVTTTNKDSLRTAIYHERRVELALEGDRFWDVVRQGRGAAVFGSMGFTAGKNEIFPVPRIQRDSCGSLTQSPGY